MYKIHSPCLDLWPIRFPLLGIKTRLRRKEYSLCTRRYPPVLIQNFYSVWGLLFLSSSYSSVPSLSPVVLVFVSPFFCSLYPRSVSRVTCHWILIMSLLLLRGFPPSRYVLTEVYSPSNLKNYLVTSWLVLKTRFVGID